MPDATSCHMERQERLIVALEAQNRLLRRISWFCASIAGMFCVLVIAGWKSEQIPGEIRAGRFVVVDTSTNSPLAILGSNGQTGDLSLLWRGGTQLFGVGMEKKGEGFILEGFNNLGARSFLVSGSSDARFEFNGKGGGVEFHESGDRFGIFLLDNRVERLSDGRPWPVAAASITTEGTKGSTLTMYPNTVGLPEHYAVLMASPETCGAYFQGKKSIGANLALEVRQGGDEALIQMRPPLHASAASLFMGKKEASLLFHNHHTKPQSSLEINAPGGKIVSGPLLKQDPRKPVTWPAEPAKPPVKKRK